MRLPLVAAIFAILCAKSSAYDNGSPIGRLPVLGWSSWVALGPGDAHPIFDYCDEPSVMNAIDAMVELGLRDFGYTHINLDDCWAHTARNASGYLMADPTRFPNGIKPVIDYAHQNGLTMGLYTCGGFQTCVGGRMGSRGHYPQDAAFYAEVGADWMKMDWCNSAGLDPKTSYPQMSQALNATGRHIHFNMCEWGEENPWEWGDAVAQSWRMAGDHTATWESTKQTIRASMAIPAKYTGRPYGWNDMDMLQTGNFNQSAYGNGQRPNMTAEEYQTEYSLFSISASNLIFTSCITDCSQWNTTGKCTPMLNDVQKKILFNQEIIAINQDVTPQGTPIVQNDPTVWARQMSDGSVAIALYNEEDSNQRIGFHFSQIGWGEGTQAKARDLIQHQDLGVFTDTFPNTTVLPHQAVMLRFYKV